MHPIRFGFCVPIFASAGGRLFRTANYPTLETATTMAMAQEADALGYDDLWVADHLMLGKDNAILEGWTTLSALAGSTKQARLGLIHQAHFFRHPTMTAKMTATLDQISGGRFLFFTDPAYGKAEHVAYGLAFPPDIDDAVARTLEGTEIVRQLWAATAPISFQGQYYHFENATATPLPVQQPHPPIWFGRNHPAILEACARYGQGWNTTPAMVEKTGELVAELSAACATVGRDVNEIERSLETQLLIAPDQATLRERLQEMMTHVPDDSYPADVVAYCAGETDALPPSLAERFIIGTTEQVKARLQEYIDVGITHFMLWFMDAPRRDGLQLFAEQIMPYFRAK